MEEYFDILDEDGNLTGEKRLRSEAHTLGLWHQVVHICVYRIVDNRVQILAHLRSKTKDILPDSWSIKFGGHLKAGETITQALTSELEDEIGLKVEEKNLLKGAATKRDNFPNREFTHTYFYQFKEDLSNLSFNDGEVQEVKWMGEEEILDSINQNPDDWASAPETVKDALDFIKNVK